MPIAYSSLPSSASGTAIPSRRRVRADRLGDGVLLSLLGGGGERDRLVQARAPRTERTSRTSGSPRGQRPGLVEDDDVGLREALEVLPPFDEHPFARRERHRGERARGHGDPDAGAEVGDEHARHAIDLRGEQRRAAGDAERRQHEPVGDRSASRWSVIGLAPAPSRIWTIFAAVVSPPTRSTSTTICPSTTTVAASTRSPAAVLLRDRLAGERLLVDRRRRRARRRRRPARARPPRRRRDPPRRAASRGPARPRRPRRRARRRSRRASSASRSRGARGRGSARAPGRPRRGAT